MLSFETVLIQMGPMQLHARAKKHFWKSFSTKRWTRDLKYPKRFNNERKPLLQATIENEIVEKRNKCCYVKICKN